MNQASGSTTMNTKCRTKMIDISVTLTEDLPVWPGGYGFHKQQVLTIESGSDANVTRLDFDVHSGTHIDAPLHFVANGKTTLEIPLSSLVGKAVVLQFKNKETITAPDLMLKAIPPGTKKLLLKTDNSQNRWHTQPFNESFVAIDADAAMWLVENEIELVGIDGPSIQKFHHTKDTHVNLLANGVVILEGLDLLEVDEGMYELICLPIKAAGCEGVPARAILKRYE